MEKNLIWLSISLFYDKTGWHTFMQYCLKDFLRSENFRSDAVLYTLVFNSERGDNIQLTILTDPICADALLIRCERYFSSFFRANPISRPNGCWIPGDHFFMPFPTNTIQYGIYRSPKANGRNPEELFGFDMCLSDCLLDAIDEPLTIDKMLFVAVILNFSVIYALTSVTGLEQPIDQSKYWMLKEIKAKGVYSKQAEAQQVFSEIYHDNESLFHSIRDHVIYGAGDDTELPLWVAKWKSECIREIQKRLHRNIPVFHLYFQFTSLISQQLGFDDKFQSLVDFVVETVMMEGAKMRSFQKELKNA